MTKKMVFVIFAFTIFLSAVSCSDRAPSSPAITVTPQPTVNTTAPASTVRMIWIHHSTGSDWVASGYGNLGTNLNANNYYVTEADYGWAAAAVSPTCGGTDIGNRTDTFDWPCWFNGYTMPSVYTNTSHYDYTNTISDPGGECEIVMFKSCFPNSEVGSDITDEQAVYNGLLSYFAAHTDKLFILIIPPPMRTISDPAATRSLSNWLADRQNGWLAGYAHKNVFAYDYYNVLTHPDNHHMISNGVEVHTVANSQNTLYYPSNSGTDDHPNAEGQQKATAEFVPVLNYWYNSFKCN